MKLARAPLAVVVFAALVQGACAPSRAASGESGGAGGPGVGAQYDGTHVYVAPADLGPFVASFIATFGGEAFSPATKSVTPTPSSTQFVAVRTPAGPLSVFAFTTPIPYPFGAERTGYLVKDMDAAVEAAEAAGADLIVAPFADPIGRDAVIQWPGAVTMQLYLHTTPPRASPLAATPENRVYVSPLRADAFLAAFLRFSKGHVVSDEPHAPGLEIGRPGETFRLARVESAFGRLAMFVTDGRLPFPFGREITGYEVANLPATLEKARAAGAAVLVEPFEAGGRASAMVQFPGGYIAEIHADSRPDGK